METSGRMVCKEEAKLRLDRSIGSLPDLWDRNAVFVANLLSLFFGNRRGAEVLRQEVGTLESYGGRLLPIVDLVFCGGKNLLVLEGFPDSALLDYFRETLGLTLPDLQNGLLHEDYLALLQDKENQSDAVGELVETVARHPAEWIDGFVTDKALVKLAELTGKRLITSLKGSREGNDKVLLHEFLVLEGLPVFDTCIAENAEEVPGAIRELKQRGYQRGVVKAPIGASGVGMVRIDFDQESAVPDYLFHEGPCLVQGWLAAADEIEFIGSPSVQLFLGEGLLSLYDVTEQVLTPQSVHEGNLAPPPYFDGDSGELREELLRQAEIAGRWLFARGYRGTASVDFHVVKRKGEYEVRICEINARITGATYPSLLARRFRPNGAWVMRNLRFTEPYSGSAILETLKEACLLYQPTEGNGILPINFNLTRDDFVVKGQFLAIGRDLAQVRGLFEYVKRLESILWEYDRD